MNPWLWSDRHLFATRWIESGVDIPTVSRWLGQKTAASSQKNLRTVAPGALHPAAQRVTFAPVTAKPGDAIPFLLNERCLLRSPISAIHQLGVKVAVSVIGPFIVIEAGLLGQSKNRCQCQSSRRNYTR